MTRTDPPRKLHTTGSTEGFYRSWTAPMSNITTTTTSTNRNSSTPPPSTTNATRTSSRELLVDGIAKAQTMDRTVDGAAIVAASAAIRPGSLKAPAELGRSSPEAAARSGGGANNSTSSSRPLVADPKNNNMASSSSSRQVIRHPPAHGRVVQAVKSTMTKAAAAAAAEAIASMSRPPTTTSSSYSHSNTTGHKLLLRQPSLIASMTFRGMEVIFATCVEPDRGEWRVYGILARTRVIFQTLVLSDPYRAVVSILAHADTGLVAVAQAHATVQTYGPVATAAWPEERHQRPVTTLGRYIWKDQCTIHCNSIFCRPDESHVVFVDRRHGSPSTSSPTTSGTTAAAVGVDLSLSSDQKVLVAFRNQLAVFDVSSSHPEQQAELVWTTRLELDVITAKFSGDGLAICLVVKGEGVENDNPFGVRTFIRDEEDGSANASDIAMTATSESSNVSSSHHPLSLERTKSIGVIYQPGPFLVHTAPVSRISFRGLGHVTSNVLSSSAAADNEGNDLLLTYCNEDCSVRVFNQNGWKQLMHWTTPPNSRADWVKGISAFTLGDLDATPMKSKFTSSAASSRRTSFSDTEDPPTSAAATGGNTNHSTTRSAFPPPPTSPAHPAPSSAAGAWIAELTFRNAFPALRLSRLSYMKRGDDDVQPSHFESVAAILPAGSIVAGGVLDGDDAGLSVHGVWPAWNPCTAGSSKDVDTTEPMTGSAMAILGMSAAASHHHPSGAYYGQSVLGGTHSPPSELKIIASHPLTGKVLIMEFPLWGDRDLGAMELGSPLRYLLSLADVGAIAAVGRNNPTAIRQETCSDESKSPSSNIRTPSVVSVEYESSRLCAQIEPDSSSVAITWRRHAGISVLPESFVRDGFQGSPFVIRDGSQTEPTLLQDITNISVPLSLPPLRLPHCCTQVHNNKTCIVAVCWWPDENFGGPPLLLVVTSTGTILVFEIPPPWSAMEPSMPNYDPSLTDGSVLGDYSEMNSVTAGSEADNDHDESFATVDYEVSVTPDPDFGLGLRLESYEDSSPTVVGSFKKHPLHGGRLPAEKSGKISLGDELLFVNNVDLEGMSFDNVIETVRRVGAEAGAGAALSLRFRRRKKFSTRFQHSDSQDSPSPANRRTAEQIFSLPSKRVDSTDSSISSGPVLGAAAASQREPAYRMQNRVATVLVGAGGESQQEFSRIIAIVDKALPDLKREDYGSVQSRILISPWTFGNERPSADHNRGSSVLVYAQGRKIYAKRLDVASDCDPERARLVHIGSCKLGFKALQDPESNGKTAIQRLIPFETGKKRLCFAACDDVSEIRLVFVDFAETEPTSDEMFGVSSASFREYLVVQFDQPLQMIRAFSPELFVTLSVNEQRDRQTLRVWSPTTNFASFDSGESPESPLDEYDENCYVYSEVSVPLESANEIPCQNEIIDVVFTRSGCLDAHPWLIAFSRIGAVVYQRLCGKSQWSQVLKIAYSSTARSDGLSSSLELNTMIKQNLRLSPVDTFPHLLPSLILMISSSDESNRMRSDWHPDALLACLCSDQSGVKETSRSTVREILLWVAESLTSDEGFAYLQSEDPLKVIPSKVLQGLAVNGNEPQGSAKSVTSSTGPFAIGINSQNRFVDDRKEETLLRDFQHKLQEVDKVPSLLQRLTRNERNVLHVLVDLVLQPPDFGSLDVPAQLTLFCVALLRQIKSMPDKEAPTKAPTPVWPFHQAQQPSFAQTSPANTQKDRDSMVASSAVLSALASCSQGSLLEACRFANEKLDWARAKELRLPFWIRSDQQLRKISEEIGQRSYQQRRDIMESALFFVAVRNMRTLRNLAATDSSESGRKFSSFISNFDFASARGRQAAEKNAYSLLRKRRFGVAATFFLLPDPPMLNSAIETIATKMEDLDLAFFVTRLVESTQARESTNSVPNLAQFMGGGGGYAASAEPTSTPFPDDQKYHDWKPSLRKASRQLLLDRGVPSAVNDRCLTAVQFIWLGQPEKASQHLASNASISSKPDNKELGTPVVSNGQYALLNIDKVSALDGVKSFIDFASTPFNLEAIGASSRSKWASTIRVSSELSMRGIDVPSIGALLGLSDLLDQEGNAENSKSVTPLLKHNRPAVEALPTPSIFDQYDVPSTIFDSFDAMPPPRSAQAQTIAPKEAATASSIFDSFDVPPPARTSIQKAEPTASSIFGAFDTPAQNTASRVETTAPSIFDSFDVPAAIQRPAPKTETKAPSIFDSFDVPASALAPPPTPRTEAKESSIFDSFDVASGSLPNQQLSTNANDAAPVVTDTVTMPEASPELPLEDCKPITRIPPLWREWRTSVLLNAIARRLIREIVATISLLYTDLFESSLDNFSTRESSKSASVNEILHRKCDGNEVIAKIRGCVDSVCVVSGLNEAEILDEALHLLASPCSPRRTVLAVLLHCAAGREDLAEDNIRHLAHGVIQYCEFLSLSNDDVVNSAKSICHFSSTCIRQRAASASWQLETCLWLHRGGAFPLSQVAMSEAIVAVRVGLVIAAWNRDYDCLDAMLRCEPDCEMDRAGGSQLWGSLKMLAGPSDSARKHAGQSNGGWEFLVETRRAGATEMLKSKSTGCFIIRPHRDDDCVFTLSFKTNLVPTVEANPDTEPSNIGGDETTTPKAVPTKIVKEDDVVQHAVVRLSDSGFRCGSFGPFPTLMQLLEAVSSSLPFPLRFDQPPVEGLMGGSDLSHPSPNAVFLLKLATDSHAETLLQPPVLNDMVNGVHSRATAFGNSKTAVEETDVKKKRSDKPDFELRKKFGRFAELLLLSEIRKQLSSIAAAAHDSASVEETTFVRDGEKAASIRQSQQGVEEESDTDEEDNDDDDDDDSLSESNPDQLHIEMQHSVASRTLRPLLVWCRSMEISAEWELAPALRTLAQGTAQRRVTLSASETAIELAKEDVGSLIDGGDAVLRRMIQPGSGVEFRTLRLGEGGHSAVVVLFSQSEAIEWFISTGAEATKESAMARLKMMESRRVIEPVDLKQLGVKAYSANKGPALVERGIRYRFVDPWEVEAVGSKEGEIKSATLGRAHLRTFDLNLVSQASENVIRSMGGVSLLKLWDHLKGGIALTKAIASIHPPWERGAGGDLQVVDGTVNEPSAFLNSVSQHLYRNTLFRRLKTPQRFLALIQIELLDLKNLTSPLGMSALTVYALLRLKRGPSGAPLHNKSRTLDSVATHPMKLGKTSGPNAPASWGSVVRFRFPLPEDVTCDAVSYDGDREALFKGPPCVLQISVYEKKFMTDTFLGGADVKLDDLSTVGQLEEWVPLRVVKHGISVNWFARIRLTLRFELMCLHPLGEHASHDNTTTTPEGENEDDDNDEEEDETDDVPAETSTPSALQLAPSVGLRRIRELSRIGGADEDIIKKSASTPDLLGYFENMAY